MVYWISPTALSLPLTLLDMMLIHTHYTLPLSHYRSFFVIGPNTLGTFPYTPIDPLALHWHHFPPNWPSSPLFLPFRLTLPFTFTPLKPETRKSNLAASCCCLTVELWFSKRTVPYLVAAICCVAVRVTQASLLRPTDLGCAVLLPLDLYWP